MFIRFYLEQFVTSWVELLDALLGILTLGMYRPNFAFKFIVWLHCVDIKTVQNIENTEENINETY